jgi:tetratricopeptide (TPR) repeat protein
LQEPEEHRKGLTVAAAFLALLLTASAPAPQPQQAIVVTGRPLSATERALQECIARHCPPNEDIDAALAHAENLFVAGRYDAARRVTLAALGRDRRYGRQYPVPVSDLYRANAHIAAHLGESGDFEYSTAAMRRVLKDALPQTDPRLVSADVEAGDMYSALARFEQAGQLYDRAIERAESAKRPDLADVARVRKAWMSRLQGDNGGARATLEAMAANGDPAHQLGRLSSLVLLARLDRMEGRKDSSDRLIAQMQSLHARQPVLIYAPEVELHPRLMEGDAAGMPNGSGADLVIGGDNAGSPTRLMPTDNFDDRWVDVGFWVTPDGKVKDAEILRSHGQLDWAQPVLRSVTGRLYSPAEGSGTYKVERYSWTARWMTVTGSRMRQRGPNPRIEYLDLTTDASSGTR